MLVLVEQLDLAKKADYINIMNDYKTKNNVHHKDPLHPLSEEDKFCWDNVRVDRIQSNYQFNVREYVSIESNKIVGCFYYISDKTSPDDIHERFEHCIFDTDVYRTDLNEFMKLY